MDDGVCDGIGRDNRVSQTLRITPAKLGCINLSVDDDVTVQRSDLGGNGVAWFTMAGDERDSVAFRGERTR
jgi:hypothetical protein